MPPDGFVFFYNGLEDSSCSSLNCAISSIDNSYELKFSGESYGDINKNIIIDYIAGELIFTSGSANTILVQLEKINI
jgi:hypothetical protein